MLNFVNIINDFELLWLLIGLHCKIETYICKQTIKMNFWFTPSKGDQQLKVFHKIGRYQQFMTKYG